MSPGQQITFQPSLAHMFAEHLHDPAIRREVFIHRENRFHPDFIRHRIQRLEPIRGGLIGSHDSEVATGKIELHHVPQECP